MTEQFSDISTHEHLPTAETELQTALAERLALVANVKQFADDAFAGRTRLGLHAHQVPAFEDTVGFLDRQISAATQKSDLTVSGYLDLPTSFGKTVIMAKIALAMGIGQPLTERNPTRRRALVLVPTQTGLRQVIGNAKQGFGQHAPDLSVTPYYSDTKDLSGDVVVMTYASFREFVDAIEAGTITDPNFDVLLCDEAHHTLGAGILRRLETYRQGKIALGLTATPEFDERRTIEQVFETRIHKSELRPLIHAGRLNGVQLIGLTTNSQIRTLNHKGDFSPVELQALRFDDERNDSIVEMAQQLVAEGRRGVINAIPGNGCQHAVDLAATLNGSEVIGPDGQPIIIRAEAIGSTFLTPTQQTKILEDYKLGKIHILTQVDTLNESWDEDDVDFIINAAPTTSKVKAFQRIGRGLRQSGDWPITVIVEFMDYVVGRKMAYTAWHVFDEEEYSQSTVITTPDRERNIQRRSRSGRARQNMGGTAMRTGGMNDPGVTEAEEPAQEPGYESSADTSGGAESGPATPESESAPVVPERNLIFDIDAPDLPERLQTMSDTFKLNVARVLNISKFENLGPPKPGWVNFGPLANKYRNRLDMGPYAIRSVIINEGGFGCELTMVGSVAEYYVEPGAVAFLETYEPTEYAPKGWKVIPDIERSVQTTRMIVQGAIDRLKALGVIVVGKNAKEFRSRTTRRKHEHYNPQATAAIEANIRENFSKIPSEEDKVTLVADLAAEVNQKRNTVQFFLTRHHGIIGSSYTSPTTKRATTGYTEDEANLARFHYAHGEVPAGAVTLEALEVETGVAEVEIRTASQSGPLKDLLQKGRYVDARGNYHYTLYCTADNRPTVVKELRKLVVTEVKIDHYPEVPTEPVIAQPVADQGDVYDLESLLREVRCSPAVVRLLLRQIPVHNQGIIKDPAINGGRPAIVAYAADVLRRRCRELGGIPASSRSDYSLSRKWNRPRQEIHSIVSELAPLRSEIGLHHDAQHDIVTFFYTGDLVIKIERELRRRHGRPVSS